MPTRWTERDHRWWGERLKAAEGQQAKRHEWWKRSVELYSMEYWRKLGFSGQLTDPVVPVNYATTFIMTKLASVFARNPKIFVRPRPGRGRLQPFAETMERLIERFWDDANQKDVILEIIRDTLLFGIGWIECGYTASLKSLPEPVPVDESQEESESFRDLFRQLRDVLSPKKSEPLPSQQGVLEPQQIPGEFYSIRRSPYTVLLADGFQHLATSPYVILWDRLRVEDFLRHPRYRYKEEALARGVSSANGSSKLYSGKFKTAEYQFDASSSSADLDALGIRDDQVIDLYHLWDRRAMQVTTITKGSPLAVAGPDEWPDLADGYPVVELTFASIPDTPEHASPYPFGMLEPIMGQVIEKSNIRQAMVEHRRRAKGLVFAQKGGMTEEEVTNYAQANQAFDVVMVSNIEGVKPGPQVNIPAAVFETEAAIDRDLDRDSQMQLALDPSKASETDRATVASIMQTNANLGTIFLVDRIENFSKRLARRQAQVFWQYKSRVQVGEELGIMPGPEAWPPLSKDVTRARQQIQRELEFRVEAGSTRPIQDDVLDREQFIRMIATVQATSPRVYRQIERQMIALLAKRFREPALESAVLRVMDEEEAQGAATENQLLDQGHPQYVSPGEDHETHIRVHMMNIQQGQVSPLRIAHIKAHQQRINEEQAGQGRSGQGVRQSVASPSGSEVARMGAPGLSDLGGQSLNLREGLGSLVGST